MATGDHYILDANRTPVLVEYDDAWWKWYNIEENRRVAGTELRGGSVTVSTVFTAYDITPDHCLFETMAFGDTKYDRQAFRSMTWEDAETMHTLVVKLVSKERREK